MSQWAETHPGLEQYSINKFGEALEIIPRVLAENTGVKPKEVISKLYAAHSEGNTNMGFDIEGESGEIKVSIDPSFLDYVFYKPFNIFSNISFPSSGLCREQHFGSDDCQEVGPEVRD